MRMEYATHEQFDGLSLKTTGWMVSRVCPHDLWAICGVIIEVASRQSKSMKEA